VFQPHRFSRLQRFAGDLASALSAADRLFVAEVYPAFEAPIPGVTSALLMEELAARGRSDARRLPREKIADAVASAAVPGDGIVIMGAGDIGALAPLVAEKLRARHKIKS
ncbi:MAG: UDP-N-acetylmuramate--L-alanine ligase, partial [Candidatus Aureabacteria bacterium]|nr:UDP-N-acetylmuramate--L-alanine ligase [Candidatus Auribacterota bacterium]